MLVAVAAVVGLIWAWPSQSGLGWVFTIGLGLGGAFSIVEGAVGWCVIRALGVRTRV
jgi:cyanate permease